MNGDAVVPHTHGRSYTDGRRRTLGTAAAAVLRALVAAAGLAAIGYGIHGLINGQPATNPPNTTAWLIGGILAHDLMVVPVTMAAGFVLSRLIPAPYRAVLQAALLVSGSVALASLPLWRGYGGSADNPSVNPLPYGRNLGIVLGLVWTCAAAVIVHRAVRARRKRAGSGIPSDPPVGP
ncbi:hypothetical protein [Protofrankia symbiont of Coriaria ruscifolia]|uniref:hypothetical protein n=1 Tax=Protofrankia symbiont of Coriaria ruscifolia TaxID=1306542 RepID=UPI001F5F8035|nr:hypothetical protein [Protofrankia symbiont of Coriaria ruscifolia]